MESWLKTDPREKKGAEKAIGFRRGVFPTVTAQEEMDGAR